ncbi:hypothetical protein [Armatimonas sp.]|uniref:hypothetical protein n=1 Tax=Armatimonas sp. TaxID=1872638 RepID=UPI00286BD304|nr:hypothetical protein [Armatimonas sp.]
MSEERVCLDFLLKELRRWRTENRVPETFLAPLYDEYTARREALDPPRLAMYDLSGDVAPQPTPAPPPRRGFLAFLEERNIAALHLVGSLLLLAGLVLLVQWQWDGIGRFLLLFVLALAAAGLLRLSDSLREEHPQSAQVLGVVGCLIIPLCGIALKVFGLASLLSWPLTALLTSFLSGGIYAWRLRTTGESLLIGLLAAAGAGAVWGAAGLLPSMLFWPTLILGLLGLATLSFWGVQRDGSPQDRMRALSGHLLTLAGMGTSLLYVAQGQGEMSNAVLGVTFLVAAGLYGLTGSRLQIAWLGYAATFTAALGTQFLLPDGASLVARGGILAATGTLTALLSRLSACPEPYQKSAEFLTLLGALSVVLDPQKQDLPIAGLFIATTVLWRVASRTPRGLLCVSALSLAAARLLTLPLDTWFVSLTHLPANELRWLLLPALAFGLGSLRTASDEHAIMLRQSACAAFSWACVGQLNGLWNYAGERTTAVACGSVLLLASSGLGGWGFWQSRPQTTRYALIPLGLVTAVQWLAWLHSTPLLPQTVLAFALALAGATLKDASGLGLRAALWLLAAGHLAAGMLPPALLPFWGLALVPVLLWLDRTEDNAPKQLRLTEFVTVLSFLAAALLPSGITPLSLLVTGLALAVVPLRLHRPSGVATAASLATATVTLAASGFPHPHFSLAQAGFLLSGISLFWLGLAAGLRRSTPLWEVLSKVSVATVGVAVVVGLLGLAGEDQGRWTIFTLGLGAITLAATAGLRSQPNYLHGAFACAFTAFGLYFFDQYGLGSNRLNYFLLPLGIYLLFVAERMDQAPLRGPGLLLLLGSSFLAVALNPHEWQHAILLVLECLIAVAAGIGQRVKVYLGGGVAFLIALLINKLWDPLREINFGVYLTILGIGVLAVALQFEKRKEALRRWADSVRDTYQSWD